MTKTNTKTPKAPTVKLTTITPKLALEMLGDRSENQRNVRFYKVKILAALMAQGDDTWMLNGDSIKFDWNGSLIDGQHRLEAVVLSNATIQAYVVRGLAPEVFSTLDIGTPRNLGDVFRAAGHDRANERAALTTWLWRFSHGPNGVNRREGAPSVLALALQDKWANNIGEAMDALPNIKPIQNRWTAFLRMLYVVTMDEMPKERLDLWASKMSKGFPMEEGDSAAGLRDYLIAWTQNSGSAATTAGRKTGRMGPSRPPIFMIKGWNAYVQDRKLTAYRLIKNEKWQRPIGLHPDFQEAWAELGIAPRGQN